MDINYLRRQHKVNEVLADLKIGWNHMIKYRKMPLP